SVHLPQFEITRALSAIGKHRISFFPATPQMVESMGNYLLVDKKRVSSVERCLAAGPELTEEMIQNFEKRTGRKVIGGYAPPSILTLTHAHPVAGKHKDGSVGLPISDTEAKIVDPANLEKEMAAGEAGELVIRGPQLMKGFADMPEETGKRIRDGWLYTGERARMDEDGFFYILGK
ncbi:MAG: AMP-binding protein, partial [Deltaproteobacteria bacterium]|nr:AMP-binding protein [Deltaproteobacteria bacterium]